MEGKKKCWLAGDDTRRGVKGRGDCRTPIVGQDRVVGFKGALRVGIKCTGIQHNPTLKEMKENIQGTKDHLARREMKENAIYTHRGGGRHRRGRKRVAPCVDV